MSQYLLNVYMYDSWKCLHYITNHMNAMCNYVTTNHVTWTHIEGVLLNNSATIQFTLHIS